MNHAQLIADHTLYAQPRSATADLRDFLDARHGVGGWSYRTGVGLGTDIQPAVHDALDAIRARYSRGKLLIPPTGLFRVASLFDPGKMSGIVMEGLGSQASKFVVDVNAGTLFNFTGAAGFTGGGVRGIGGFLEDGHPTSNAEIMRLDGDGTGQPDQFVVEDLYFSRIGTSFWANGLVLNGMDRTSPQGTRIGTIRNFQIFCCRISGIGIYNAVGWTMENIGTYAGTGTGNDVTISGGGASNTNSTQIDIRGLWCGGALILANATDVTIHGKAATVTAATSFNYHAGVVNAASLSGALGPKGTLQVVT